MNILLVFFAFPIATIILSVVLQKILKCPVLVAATTFAIYLVITFAVFDIDFLIFVIVYTLISYITAIITRFICNFNKMIHSNCGRNREYIQNNNLLEEQSTICQNSMERNQRCNCRFFNRR